ncbi:MAG: iron-containing alcohol dehydrogenase [Phycisphaerae bacterium]|nr:iron-containing alcohol dehydrogenase [Phycisphaerae bacterium]
MLAPEDRVISLRLPPTLRFGRGCAVQLVEDLTARGVRKVLVVTAGPIVSLAEPIVRALQDRGVSVILRDSVNAEPDRTVFEAILREARSAAVDTVVGIGGGSALDVAKLVAALVHADQSVQEVFGIDKVRARTTHLACLPTTAGTGSEVSPNAILLDEADHLKKAVVSPWLVPDAAYVDPLLTRGVPPAVTAATGLDALTHCIEAYANRFAHPITDLLALKGIELIGANLETACRDGANMEARTALALGSLYGGLCLGPVNTGAVHALAYPLGSEYHVPHGLSNAVLLAGVMEFNLPAMAQRYGQVALALGCPRQAADLQTASLGVERIRQLTRRCGAHPSLSQWGVTDQDIERLARSAMTVTRLLKNNPREVTLEDAEALYRGLL